MKVKYPKVKVDSNNRIYVEFKLNNKRYRLFNGSKINSEIYPGGNVKLPKQLQYCNKNCYWIRIFITIL